MGAPTIKRNVRKEQQRLLKQVKQQSKTRPWFCTILQNPDGAVLGVAVERYAVERLYPKLQAQGVDTSMAECKDFEVMV